MMSVYKGPEVISALIAGGARLEEVSDGHTALYMAACSGNVPVVRVLLAAGANARGSTRAPAVDCVRSTRAEEVQRRQRFTPDQLGDRRPLRDFDEVIALLEAAEQKR
jgi:ankyrin repeat protein